MRPTDKDRAVEQAGIVTALLSLGIDQHNAKFLATNYSAVVIEKQIALMPLRVNVQNPASFLIQAIKNDYPPPQVAAPPRVVGGINENKYYTGAMAICPQCQARPCAPECPTLEGPARTRRATITLSRLRHLGCDLRPEGATTLRVFRRDPRTTFRLPSALKEEIAAFADELHHLVSTPVVRLALVASPAMQEESHDADPC